ncbi:MAG: M28 family peptidase [Alloprevotella sp.]|nr:M28 family peptidase [Alloprevotella sp.]
MKRLCIYIILCTALLAALVSCKKGGDSGSGETTTEEVCPVKFNADSAFTSIERQCSFGPRVPNSAAHDSCAIYIASAFRAYGLSVSEQRTTLTAWDGNKLGCINIIAQYKPEAQRRVLICTHWESRPWADQDADESKRREPVMAANDGASGVAVMLEIARNLKELNPSVGIDFVCFDCEDYGAPEWAEGPGDGSDWCLGSQYFATHLPEGYVKPAYGILLDMVGGQDAQFLFEQNSKRYAEDVVARVWGCAATAEATDWFVSRDGMAAIDDHIPLIEKAGIPTIDIISNNGMGFSSTWHTTQDTPAFISRDVLRAVGQTLLQVLYEEES